jgi:Domain of unknown function (DUF4440)
VRIRSGEYCLADRLASVGVVGGLAGVERERLRAIVGADVDALDRSHAAGFVLCTPSGAVWNRSYYLGGLADGSIRYLRFEPEGEIEAVEGEGVGAVRYRSVVDIAIDGRPVGHLECWHLDVYVRGADGLWRCQWSQATDTLGD